MTLTSAYTAGFDNACSCFNVKIARKKRTVGARIGAATAGLAASEAGNAGLQALIQAANKNLPRVVSEKAVPDLAKAMHINPPSIAGAPGAIAGAIAGGKDRRLGGAGLGLLGGIAGGSLGGGLGGQIGGLAGAGVGLGGSFLGGRLAGSYAKKKPTFL